MAGRERERRSTGGSSSSSSMDPNASALALAQTIAKEKRVEYRWALGVVQRQQQEKRQQEPEEATLSPSAAALSPATTTPTTIPIPTTLATPTTLAAADPSERLSRRLALSINPGWISSSSSSSAGALRRPKSVAHEAFAAPFADEEGAALLLAQRAADAAVARAALASGAGEAGRLPPNDDASLAFHRRRDAFTAYVEAAAKARLVARGGYCGRGASGGDDNKAGE